METRRLILIIFCFLPFLAQGQDSLAVVNGGLVTYGGGGLIVTDAMIPKHPTSEPVDYTDTIFYYEIQHDWSTSGVGSYTDTELVADFGQNGYTGLISYPPEYANTLIIDGDTCLRLYTDATEVTNTDFFINLDSAYEELYLTFDMKVRDGMVIHPDYPVSPADNYNDYGGKFPGLAGSYAGGGGIKYPDDPSIDPEDGSWVCRTGWTYLGESRTYHRDQVNWEESVNTLFGHDPWEPVDSACSGTDCFLIYDNVDWVTYTLRVTMNTVGQTNGVMNAYIGDSCIYGNNTMEWRGDSAVGIDFVWMVYLFGGWGYAYADEYLDIDNLVVWKYHDDVPGNENYPTVKTQHVANSIGDIILLPQMAGRRME